MRYASVCDEIGAVHVAWQPLGWHCEWTAEIDAFPAAVVEQRWGFPNRGDMTRFKEWDDAPIELLVGGTPCQSFSVAGLRKGLHDPRGGLMLTFLEIAQRYRPRWVVWENVPGVLSSNGGRDFGAFLGALGELGYGWAYRVLDAQWFGVAQRRRRVFVVGYLGDERRAAQVLFESESVRRDNPPSREKGQGATYDVAPCIGASGRGFERAGETRGQDPVVAQPYRIANCLTQRMHKGFDSTLDSQTPVVAFHPTQDPISSQDGLVHALGTGSSGGCATAAVAIDLQNVRCGGDVAGTLDTTRPSRGGGKAVAFTKSKRAQSATDDESWVPGDGGRSDAVNVVVPQAQAFTHSGYSNKPAWITGDRTDCLPSSGHGDTSHQGIGVMQAIGFDGFQSDNPKATHQATIEGTGPLIRGRPHCVATALAVRRLTPRECERLQGFPDDYTAIEYRKKPAADGPRYKALGNSIAVPVMAWIGRRIAKCATH